MWGCTHCQLILSVQNVTCPRCGRKVDFVRIVKLEDARAYNEACKKQEKSQLWLIETDPRQSS